MPQARFFCRTGELAGTEHRIGAEATIGRDPENTIVLPAGVVSKRHAHIVFDPAARAYRIEDLRSRNGTRLDGAPVEGCVHLGALHVLTIGERHDFIFVLVPDRPVGATVGGGSGEASQTATAHDPSRTLRAPRLTDTPVVDEPDEPETVFGPPSVVHVPPLAGATLSDGVEAAGGMPPDPSTVLEAPSLVAVPPKLAGASDESGPEDGSSAPAAVLDPASALSAPLMAAVSVDPRLASASRVAILVLPDGARRRIELPAGRHVVGRSHDCAIRIDDRALSREHAVFVVRGGAVTVEDLNSQNGTFLDGQPVRASAPVQIGQSVTFGDRITAVLFGVDQS